MKLNLYSASIATGMPKINSLILLVFNFSDILECTVFCALLHIFLCSGVQFLFIGALFSV
jgi:hypothetical protein